MSPVYMPAEDSYLLSDILKKKIPALLKSNPMLKVLEIGAGSGIQLQTLKQLKVKNIFSCDINPDTVRHCKRRGFDCVESDLFENIKGKFDLIIFNPPYLPCDKNEPRDSQLATTGGKSGSEIINRFLKQAKNYLTPDGRIFLVTSSLTKGINWTGWKKELIKEEGLFFEELFVYELIMREKNFLLGGLEN